MTLEELRLRIHALFPDDEVVEVGPPDSSVGFEISPPGDHICIFWEADTWEVWRLKMWLEGTLRSEIKAVSAHQLIAARRRLLADAD